MSAAVDSLRYTPNGEPRGYIQPGALKELWFHTGTACNLACPFCFEGSKPGDGRLDRITLGDVRPLMEEAVSLGAQQFSFTGGEPFIVKNLINILRYASSLNPCLVLTNGTDPVLKRLHQIETLAERPHPISFRISIDYPDEARHDAARGSGSFKKSWRSLRALGELGFKVSVARQMHSEEDSDAVDREYRTLFEQYGLPGDTTVVSFPDFLTPGSDPEVPPVTEDCMTTCHTEKSREAFMCAFSKMAIKRNGQMRVYACTLVDDDDSYDLGGTIRESMGKRIMMRHHRCYSCFAFGSSCSDT